MEERQTRSRKEILRRYLVFFVSLFIMSFGVSLVTRSLMGTSPISSVPFVWSLHTQLSMGTYIIILNAILITAQILMLGKKGVKESKVELLMQIPVSLLFGIFIDLTMAILHDWNPTAYYMQLISCAAGCCIMALGISLEVVADVCMNSGEYVLQIASRKLHKEFGTMKILFDVTLLLIAIGSSWIFAGKIEGVREGTIIVAILTGPLVRLIRPRLKFIDRWEESATVSAASGNSITGNRVRNGMVITIGREYGSGGREIGYLVAERLHIPFYDNSMIDLAAKESGLSEQYVREFDQKLPHSLLFEIITGDVATPPEKSMSRKNALFIAQSRVIRRLASEGPCVIVGRCANFVLRDNPQAINIFLYSSRKKEIERAIRRYGVAPEEAPELVTRTNAMRRDHYSYFTGENWGDSRNYTAVFNTSNLTDEGVADAIIGIYKNSAEPGE